MIASKTWPLLGSALVMMLVACSGAESPAPQPGAVAEESPTGGGSGTGAADAPPAKADPPKTPPETTPPATPPSTGTCNAQVNDGAVVVPEMIAADAPAPTGGSVADGTYHLTSISLYTGAGGATGPLGASVKSTIVVKGKKADVVEDVNGTSKRFTQSFTTTGTTAEFAETCPGTSKKTIAAYSASTALTLFLVNDVGQTVTYTYEP